MYRKCFEKISGKNKKSMFFSSVLTLNMVCGLSKIIGIELFRDFTFLEYIWMLFPARISMNINF